MHHLTRLLLIGCAVSAALFGGCATEEIPQYGDPANLVGSAGATAGSGEASSSASGSGSGSSSSGMCMPDPMCMVSFATDVFPILEMKAKCSDADCHAPAAARAPVMTPGDAKATHAVLIKHPFNEDDKMPYIVPCNPMASKMMCNMKLGSGTGLNTYGDCAPRMPKVSAMDTVADDYLTQTELNTIAEWITCGAPDN
jgi:hypothetical protein